MPIHEFPGGHTKALLQLENIIWGEHKLQFSAALGETWDIGSAIELEFVILG
jgi:hypothetical protein